MHSPLLQYVWWVTVNGLQFSSRQIYQGSRGQVLLSFSFPLLLVCCVTITKYHRLDELNYLNLFLPLLSLRNSREKMMLSSHHLAVYCCVWDWEVCCLCYITSTRPAWGILGYPVTKRKKKSFKDLF
jgi:hypothetical protein